MNSEIMKKISFLSCVACLLSISALAQDTAVARVADTAKYAGMLPTVTYYENDLNQYKYDQLRRRILRLYPYAEIAKKILDDLNAAGSKKGTKAYMKENEKMLRDKFETELMNLSITDGQILVKLINRETGNNCYDLIKNLKGSINAFTYQLIGKRYGYDLKQPYIAAENKEMEQAIKDLKESGQLRLLKY